MSYLIFQTMFYTEIDGYKHAYNGPQNPVEIIKNGMINNCLYFILSEAFTWSQSESNFEPFR